MNIPKIKVCGLTCMEDTKLLNEYSIDYAGFVLYYEKSKRNVSIENAIRIKQGLKDSIKTVAVIVSPDILQVREIEKAGFDYVQIHGECSDQMISQIKNPVIRAFNVGSKEPKPIMQLINFNKISYVAFDGRQSGSGKTFEWDVLKKYVDNADKIMLAGGLNSKNVGEAIRQVHPAIVDVSTGVEKASGKGKDREKIKQFVESVRTSRKDGNSYE